MGNHRLIHGDCLQVLPTLAAASVDLAICDLPYAVTSNAWDCALPLAALWAELLRVATPRCAFVFTATMRFAHTLLQSQPMLFRHDLVWHKNIGAGFLNAKKAPLRYHEHILVFARPGMIYSPQITTGHAPYHVNRTCQATPRIDNYGADRDPRRILCETSRYPQSVVRHALDGKRGAGHPTQKPVALLASLLRTYSAPGATVLDPTSGVASTAVAAARTGRRSVSIERDATYYARGVERLRAELAQQPLPLAQSR